jgi:subtilisin family serine protease/uncharacterized membrane protein
MRRAVIYACVLFGALAAVWLPTSAQGPDAEVQRVGGHEAVAREALVKFRRAPRGTDLDQIVGDVDADRLTAVGRSGVYRVRSRSMDAATLVARLARRGNIEYAEPNYIVRLTAAPNDPDFSLLWGFENTGQTIGGFPGIAGADISATDAWDVSTGSPNTVVAVIDSGVDYTHEDLAANMWAAPAAFSVNIGGVLVHCAAGTHGFNALLRTCDPMDDNNHGTHVAGTIGAVGNNQRGVAGVNWTTRLMAIKFLNAQGSGSFADAISGIRFAIEAKQAFAASEGANVRVLSNSWGGTAFSQALLDEVNAAQQADMLFVAAAGNSGLDNDLLPTYPSSFTADNLVSVAATTNMDLRAYFSNYGATSVHLGAPGQDILSTTIGNTYTVASGTSMATPVVSGAAALVLSVCQLNTAALKDALIGTVDAAPSLIGRTITGGRLNVHSAVHSCLAAPPAPQDLVATAGDGRVTLVWSSALGATRYIVKRGTTAGGPYTTLASNVKGATYTDTTVVNDTTYYYVVAAANSLGESGDSNEASATPRAPSDLVVSAMSTPPPAGAGLSFTVSVTTRNAAGGTANASTTALFLSTNALYDATDERIAEVAIGPLAGSASTTSNVDVTVPADVTAGSYYLIAIADADDAVEESIEANNSRVRALSIGPDLGISSMTVPSSGTAGGTISVSTTVENDGGGSAASSTVTFFLSTNSTLDASDVALSGSRTVQALAAGATSSGSTILTIPSGTAVGSYQVIAKADGHDAIPETNEANNTSARAIQIGGDLVISAFSAPSTAGPGTVIVVTDTTTNQGTATVAASATRFYLSTNALLDQSDLRLDGSHLVPQLAASAANSASTSLSIPAATAPGAYYLFAVADADNAVQETQESNNNGLRAIQVGTDLTISAFTVPASSGPGLAVTVSETTRNQGSGFAAPTLTRYYLSTNTVVDAADTVLQPDHVVPELQPNATHSASTSLTIPANTAAGLYYLIAKADAGNAIVETQEANNILARAIAIGGDLALSAFTAPAKGGAGRSILLSETTINQGAGPVAGSTTRFYLSANALLDGSDTVLNGARSVPPLAPGATSAGSTSVTLPAGTATGTYYLIAKADGDNAIPESLESNNTELRSLQIGPDLTVSTLSVPAKGGAGLPIVVTDTTSNQGGGDAPATTVAFYLSSDFTLDAGDPAFGMARPVPSLAASATSSGQTTLTIPAGTPAGIYYVIAKADPSNALTETQETNNSRSSSIAIGPDLRVSSLTGPSSVASGGTANLNDTTINQGGGPAGTSTTRYFLSTNNTLDAADTPVGERTVPALAVNQSLSAVVAITIPAGTAAGSYYVLAQADATNAVNETPETNNVTARAIQVTMVP